MRCVRTTRSSTYSHPFQVSLPNPCTLFHKSSFIPRTCKLWSILPLSSFPESYNLSVFSLTLINLISSLSLLNPSFPPFVGDFPIGFRAFLQHYILKNNNKNLFWCTEIRNILSAPLWNYIITGATLNKSVCDAHCFQINT